MPHYAYRFYFKFNKIIHYYTLELHTSSPILVNTTIVDIRTSLTVYVLIVNSSEYIPCMNKVRTNDVL